MVREGSKTLFLHFSQIVQLLPKILTNASAELNFFGQLCTPNLQVLVVLRQTFS
jgi:hypothetical protein